MKQYVLGFIFDSAKRRVILLEKDFTKIGYPGKHFNGVGGGLDDGEAIVLGMNREGLEETGFTFAWVDLEMIIGPVDGRHITHVFMTWTTGDIDIVCQCMNEWPGAEGRYSVYAVSALPHNIIPNLGWLVPYCAAAGRERVRIL